jgi:hypothetical protein
MFLIDGVEPGFAIFQHADPAKVGGNDEFLHEIGNDVAPAVSAVFQSRSDHGFAHGKSSARYARCVSVKQPMATVQNFLRHTQKI